MAANAGRARLALAAPGRLLMHGMHAESLAHQHVGLNSLIGYARKARLLTLMAVAIPVLTGSAEPPQPSLPTMHVSEMKAWFLQKKQRL
ncbi:hypothetical protein [Thalassospira australica]|uniref:hypothetical protein n=1 Tax=Thalassospira australica TaxID=1528106 RepID=UPI0012E06759|nr:hypothetical protein [Thalassospira australica]